MMAFERLNIRKQLSISPVQDSVIKSNDILIELYRLYI